MVTACCRQNEHKQLQLPEVDMLNYYAAICHLFINYRSTKYTTMYIQQTKKH